MESPHPLDTAIRALLHHISQANSLLDGWSSGDKEQKLLRSAPIEDIIRRLREVIEELLTCKRELKTSQTTELRLRCDQFEAMLQHLEGEVRKHIRVHPTQVELQLKLQLEIALSRLQETEKEATELREKLAKQAEEMVEMKKEHKTDRRSPELNKGLPASTRVFELQSNPNFHQRLLTLRATLDSKSPQPQGKRSPDEFRLATQLRKPTGAFKSNPTSPPREVDRERFSPATERKHARVASDRVNKVARLRSAIRR